jgi:hypothetical protein
MKSSQLMDESPSATTPGSMWAKSSPQTLPSESAALQVHQSMFPSSAMHHQNASLAQNIRIVQGRVNNLIKRADLERITPMMVERSPTSVKDAVFRIHVMRNSRA